MEAIGLVASLVALVEAAGSAATIVKSIRRRLKDAPGILTTLETDLHLIKSGLQQIQILQSCSARNFLGQDDQQAVLTTLNSAKTILRSIETRCARVEEHNHKRDLIRWALVDHTRIEKMMAELRATHSCLKTLFQIIGLQEQSEMFLDIKSIKSLVIDTSDRFEGNHDTQPICMLAAQPPPNSATLRRPRKVLRGVVTLPAWLRWLGCQITAVKLSEVWPIGSLKHYTLAFHLPILPGLCSLWGQVALQTTPYCQSLSLVAPSAVSFGYISTPDSAAMLACVRGDLFRLKEQLKSGKVTLGDMTNRKWSLMTAAIKGGSKEVVEFLLDNGVNVNVTFGEHQTSPLQWAIRQKKLDIAEILVSRGADVNHISMQGWSAVFYLWPKTEIGQDVMLNQIDLLSRADDIELNLIDPWGWTVLHRLAAYGTDLELRKIIALGADLTIKQLPLGWSAIFHSVFYGNMKTLIELMRYYPQSVVFDVDERGWTLLHIAASAGHKDITRHLLEVGSNPFAESKPFFSHIPESIWGKRCTPAEVAAAQSQERLVRYEELLEDLGIESPVVLISDSEDSEEEEFWDAAEFIF